MIIKITTETDYKVLNDKKEHVRTFSKYDAYISETQDGNKEGVLKYFKNYINVKRMPKCFKVEEVKFPHDNKLHRLTGNDSMIYLVLNGKIVYEWNNNTNRDSPEDLSWDRDISEVFYSGLALGKKIAELERNNK